MKILKRIKAALTRSDLEALQYRPKLVVQPSDPDGTVKLRADTNRFFIDPISGDLHGFDR